MMTEPVEQNLRYVVGIGASAGGLDAISQFVAGLPAQSDCVFVVAQHMSASHPSLITEILARQTPWVVQEIVQDEKPLANVLYVVPPGSNLVFVDGCFHLAVPDSEGVPKPSINLLFQSMAKEFDSRSVGIILSGTGSDGTLGLSAIKAAGGLTFVQTPETAKYDGMPRSAIEAGVADYIAPPDEIGHVLDHLLRLPAESSRISVLNKPNSVTLNDLLLRILRRTQIDFSNYKQSTVQRRLQRRMNATKTYSLEAYLSYVDTHPDEIDALAKEALISVTEFFRDEEAFRTLNQYLRELVQQKQPDDELRVWAVGCATGEEAYSLTIMCLELMAELDKRLRLTVFATDIDNAALNIARHGIYSQAALAEIPPQYISRYFQSHHKGFEVIKRMRDHVVFAHHDIAVDPTFPRIDLVSCRNVLIYFNTDLQARVLAVLHHCQLENGLMFLGQSETISQQEALFSTVDAQARIFRVRQAPKPAPRARLVRGQLKRPNEASSSNSISHETVFLKALADSVGAALLIDASFQILHSHGDLGRFISFPSGVPELNLARLIVPEFTHEVSTTLFRAQRRKASAYSRKRRIGSLGGTTWCLAIHPIASQSENNLFLVVFENADQPGAQTGSTDEAVTNTEHSLVDELALTRERLQTMEQEMSTFKEEMSALTEELQTSNEELQATNEELISVNDESQIKSAELAVINSDFESLFNTVDFPVLLLDNQLMLKRANGAAMRSYDLSMASAGQSVARLNLPGHLQNIDSHLNAAISNSTKVSFVAKFNERTYQIFVTPVLNQPATVQGAVLVVIDNTDLTLAQQRTHDSQERLLSIMNHSMSLISVKDAAGCYEFVNNRFELVFGVKAQDVIGKTDQQLFGATIAQLIRAGDLDAMLKLNAVETTDGIDLARGTLWLDSIRFPIFDANGNLRSVCTQSNDVTYRRQADQQLRLASKVFDRAGEAIIITDAEIHILSVNNAFTQITGYIAADVIGKNPSILKSGQNSPTFYQTMWHSLLEQGSWQGEIYNRRKNGEIYPEWLTINAVKDDGGKVINYVAIFSDISTLKTSQQRVEFLATHDELTGIPNRSLLMDRMNQALYHAKRQDNRMAVLFIDLDNFKNINDSLGHDVGDILLKQATERIKQYVRDVDTLARLGGDEFVAVLTDIELEEVNAVATRIIDCMASSFFINDHHLHVSASIGISIYPDDGNDSISLLKNADTAMYQAKDRGRNQYQFFADEMKVIALRRLTLEIGLRMALENNHLRMVYQPKVELKSGLVMGAEALLRWRDPILGDISPVQFIPVAEGCGLISLIGERVFDMVLSQIAAWRRQGLTVPCISINVSAHQLRDDNFVSQLTDRLEEAGIPATSISIEITESALMQRIDVVREKLIKIHAMGTGVSVDDFGTGYSSLAYLRKLPLNELKVDHSFVDKIAFEQDDRSIAKTIIDMAHALGFRVIAEGVETQAQLDVLKQDGCDIAQGHFFYHPMSADDFAILLRSPHVIQVT